MRALMTRKSCAAGMRNAILRSLCLIEIFSEVMDLNSIGSSMIRSVPVIQVIDCGGASNCPSRRNSENTGCLTLEPELNKQKASWCLISFFVGV